MAITTGQLTVTTTPVAVNAPNVMPLRLHIHNNDVTNNLLVGNGNVSSSNGLVLPKLDSIELLLNPHEVIYLVASSGSIAASYLVQTE